MQRMIISLAILLCLSICGTSDALAKRQKHSKIDLDKSASFFPFTTLELQCGDFGNGKIECSTPVGQLNCGTYESNTKPLSFRAPAGWQISNASAVYSGREVFDVTVTYQSAVALTCQWHCSGSHKPFGAGGYVTGYCTSRGKPSP
jgi:hypothetical protein